MIDLKHFYQSYTRAAHLRWLEGNLEGAIQAMRLAVSSASPRDPEAGPWARTRLAYYYLQAGRPDQARAETAALLSARPGYAPALIVEGRRHLALGRADAAVRVLREAVRVHPLPEAQWLLAEALRETGDTGAAAGLESTLVREGAARDPRTCALFLATRRQSIETAVDLAARELRTRQDPFTEDAAAWALHAAGRDAEARLHMSRALSHGTADPRLFLHAGILADAAGQRVEAARWFRRARALERLLLPSERRLLNQSRKHG
jgi:tetratricopeptide (TPR) repeat protein